MELPEDIVRFDDAQRRAIALLRDVTQRLEAGMSARTIAQLAETRLTNHGFTGWYHAPEVAFAAGIGSAVSRLVPGKLEPGQLVCIDLGPTDGEAYGDVAYTFRFGGETPGDLARGSTLEVARGCVRAACGYASRWKTVGEIQIFSAAWAVNNRMGLANPGVGHRVLPREATPGASLLGAQWPRAAHAATSLMRNRIHRLHPVRMDGMFAIRPVVRGRDGAFAAFEEMVYVSPEGRVVLGRSTVDEAGTLD